MSSVRPYDVFLSHDHADREWVESLAVRLTAEHGFRVWLDRWVLVPGQHWQPAIAKGLSDATTCAVCLCRVSPDGWFDQEIQQALHLQARRPDFRVIPVLMPGCDLGSDDSVTTFLRLRTWADFRADCDTEYAFHVLTCGIRGVPIGPWPRPAQPVELPESEFARAVRQLKELQQLKSYDLLEPVVIEYQQKILSRWYEGGS